MTSHGSILVMNAGSSSIKFAVYNADLAARLHGELEGIGTNPHLLAKHADGTVLVDQSWSDDRAVGIHDLIQRLIKWLEDHLGAARLAAIGGLEHSGPVIVTPSVLAKLRGLVPLAPLHQPRNLEPIVSLGQSHPHLPQIACFDTAFHRTLPAVAQLYGLPRRLREAGAHRYGFHGLSYEYIASLLPKLDARAAAGRTVVAHLGSGASMCALQGGRSIATTMGFSPLSGLVMGTRPGDLDPGLMIWLIRERRMTVDEVERLLYRESGLKGVSGISSDMRDLLSSEAPDARQAVDLFTYKIATELGALCAALGGLDAVTFTAGICENAAEIRKAICERSSWLGMRIDDGANHQNALRISHHDSRVSVWVVPTDEELMIARHTARLSLNSHAP